MPIEIQNQQPPRIQDLILESSDSNKIPFHPLRDIPQTVWNKIMTKHYDLGNIFLPIVATTDEILSQTNYSMTLHYFYPGLESIRPTLLVDEDLMLLTDPTSIVHVLANNLTHRNETFNRAQRAYEKAQLAIGLQELYPELRERLRNYLQSDCGKSFSRTLIDKLDGNRPISERVYYASYLKLLYPNHNEIDSVVKNQFTNFASEILSSEDLIFIRRMGATRIFSQQLFNSIPLPKNSNFWNHVKRQILEINDLAALSQAIFYTTIAVARSVTVTTDGLLEIDIDSPQIKQSPLPFLRAYA